MTSHRLRTGERLCGAATENTDRGGERTRRLADDDPACGPDGARDRGDAAGIQAHGEIGG